MEESVEKFLNLYLEALENDRDVYKIDEASNIKEEEETEVKKVVKVNIFQYLNNVTGLFLNCRDKLNHVNQIYQHFLIKMSDLSTSTLHQVSLFFFELFGSILWEI
jgi:hypothetical protein